MKALRRQCPARNKKFYSYAEARSYIGHLAEGVEILGVTKGQFSLVDLLECIIDDVGPGHLTISTWTAAEYDAARMLDFVQSGRVTGMRWVIDDIFVKRQPALAMAICESSDDAVRIFKTHAKFAVIQGAKFPVVIRTSMNLNSNPRMEYFEISCDREMAGYFFGIVDEIYKSPFGQRVRLADIKTLDADPLLGLEL